MQQSMGVLSRNLECPKCGQHTIVEQRQAHIYDCLNCQFRCAIAGDVGRSEYVAFGGQSFGWLGDNVLDIGERDLREKTAIAHH